MRVLITSGGGAKGAFSVGVLRYLKEQQNIDSYDFISGTSTGALIASIASIGRFDQLANIYLNTNNAGVLEPQNLIDSLVNGDPFIFNTDPLLQQIEQNIDDATFAEIKASRTKLCFNAVSLQTGRVTVFATKEIIPAPHYDTKLITDRRMFINALLGSSNQAVFLNPIRIGDNDYVDGGNRETVPTRVVVENLNTREDHEIFILSNNPNNILELP